MQLRQSSFLIVLVLLAFLGTRTGLGHGLTHLDEEDHDECELCEYLLKSQEETPYLPEYSVGALVSFDYPPFCLRDTFYFESAFCYNLPRRVMNKPPPLI